MFFIVKVGKIYAYIVACSQQVSTVGEGNGIERN